MLKKLAMLCFASNLKYLRNKKGLSQQSFADELDLTRGQLASYEDGRAEPKLKTLVRLSHYFKLPVDTLVKHDLTMSKTDSYIDIGNNRVLFPILINNENENVIEVVPIKASAGYLNGYSDPEYISSLQQMQLPFIPTGKHRAFPIKGDSMEPWVKDGSYIVGKHIEDMRDLKNGQTYVFVTRQEGLLYKRIELTGSNHILLKSDNVVYPPVSLLYDDLLEVWEYTCKIDLQNYKYEELNIAGIAEMLRSFQVELQDIKKLVKQ